jgi:hypothetical protein
MTIGLLPQEEQLFGLPPRRGTASEEDDDREQQGES